MSKACSPKRTIEVLQEFSIPLISGVIVAIAWANLSSHSYHSFLHASLFGAKHGINFHFLVNDIFMVFFFGIATKEITESLLPGGALNPMKKAITPILGTLGGVVMPIIVYLAWVWFSGDQSIINGWGIPTATDIALAWLVARQVFGKGHPAISFLLLLAIADDGIGLFIIAVFYPDPHNPVQPIYLLLVCVGMLLAYGLRKMRVKSYWPFLFGGGIFSWCGLYFSHLHPALALVSIVPFMPASKHDEGIFIESEGGEDVHEVSVLSRFEKELKLPVDIGLFCFGLANAGVEFSSIGNATYAVFLGLAIGKTFGVFSFAFVGYRVFGFPLPTGMDLKSLFVAGSVASIGLTVALFVAGVAFTDLELQGAAKMGALFSAFLSIVAISLGRIFKVHNTLAIQRGL